ncbi:hypothetical protein L2E82_40283 [Cichorium intybus]|uniref:Uncharacterized protein n=1 Tax=Cichorium intybus TaxID=13427 RepID=A0ACB9APZ8_CICIN|nr:hypothetical protein L2E82_40283 [Cichorium intybus]
MALAVTSSTSIVFSSSNRTVQGVQPSSSNFQPSDRSYRAPTSLNFSRKRSAAVKALNGEPKRNDSIVSSAAPAFAPGLRKTTLHTTKEKPVFWPDSKRSVSISTAKQISKVARE